MFDNLLNCLIACIWILTLAGQAIYEGASWLGLFFAANCVFWVCVLVVIVRKIAVAQKEPKT